MIPEGRSKQSLRILVVENKIDATPPFITEMHDRGHIVVSIDKLEATPAIHGFDVVVTEDEFDSRMDGAAVLEKLGVSGAGVPAIVVGHHADFTRCQRAMRYGAVDFLLHPLETSALVNAVEAAAVRQPSGFGGTAFVRHYFHGSRAHERALRELGAHLMESGLGSAHRVRIATAVAQVLQHLFERRGGAPLRIEAERAGAQVTVDVGALGRMALSVVRPALPDAPSEPARADDAPYIEHARALAEELELQSAPSHEEVKLVFALSPVRFEEDDLDFSDVDYLDPRSIDRLLSVLLAEPDDQTHLIPTTMASTVGRLLAISNPKRTAEAPLGS